MPRIGGAIDRRMIWRYLIRLLSHKWHVGRALWSHGLYWRALKHDWTKFLPPEFAAYMRRTECDRVGRPARGPFYDSTLLHHYCLNSHHWQHWVLLENDGRYHPLEMPYDDAVEMVCDWVGRGRAPDSRGLDAWWAANRAHIMLHPHTQDLVERLIRAQTKAAQ